MKKLISSIFFILTSCLLGFVIYICYIANTNPEIKYEDFYNKNSTVVFDTNNQQIHSEAIFQTNIAYEDISQNVINALVSTEDDKFFSHHGYNPSRIIKAVFNDLTSSSFKEGASTITQQVIKNKYLTNDKTINRKIREIIMSIKLEKMLSKEDIITYYLNNVLYGDNIYGIYNAALYYFNKKPNNLSIDEAATIVGLIQMPNYYNPYRNLDGSIRRRNTVLKSMKSNGFLTMDEYQLYSNVNLGEKLQKNEIYTRKSYFNPYLDCISNIKDDCINTYMDSEIQNELYNIAIDKYNIIKDDNINIGAVVLDNKTAGILGIIGNRSFDRFCTNNALIKRQMASTMKPIMDYAPLFETTTSSPATIINDSPMTYSDGTALKNWDYQFKGDITLRQALKESRNIPALKIFKKISNQERKNVLKRLGMNPINDFLESDALGCGANLFSLLEVANAYLAFANEGMYKQASFVKNDEPFVRALKPSTAFFINSILHDVFAGSKFDLKNGYMMAKTGQTNYDSNTLKKYNIPSYATKDSFVISYTKNLTFACYIGYDSISSSNYLDRRRVQIPRAIMAHFMNKFAYGEKIMAPNDVVYKRYEYHDNTIYLSNSGKYDYFILGAEPKEYYKKKYYYSI